MLLLIAPCFKCKFYSTLNNIFRWTQGWVLTSLREQYLQSKETHKNKEKSEKVEGKKFSEQFISANTRKF